MTKQEEAKLAAETIERAENVLKTKGWVKGTFKDPKTGAVCALQAIRDANGKGAVEAARIVVKLLGTDLVIFNDKASTTLPDVLNVLAAAKNIAKELSE